MTFDRKFCVDCHVDTFAINEYYMVTDAVWLSVVSTKQDGMLCIGCLENRLRRKLVPDDFTCALINSIEFRGNRMSPRLIDRLKRNPL